jgi:hypothetical protein
VIRDLSAEVFVERAGLKCENGREVLSIMSKIKDLATENLAI